MNKEESERKLKRERVEACLNCKNFVKCDNIGSLQNVPTLRRLKVKLG
jgi:hypothetical protein